MSDRDQFAASALAGLLSAPKTMTSTPENELMRINSWLYARVAYELADAMLAERAKKPENGQ